MKLYKYRDDYINLDKICAIEINPRCDDWRIDIYFGSGDPYILDRFENREDAVNLVNDFLKNLSRDCFVIQ